MYLSMGMTYELFWIQDSTLVKYYRKAYEMQRQRANYDAWLNGLYTYDALCSVSPILHAFAKSGTKPTPYREEPYAVKEAVDPATAKAEFLAKWKSDKEKWKRRKTQRLNNMGGGASGKTD